MNSWTDPQYHPNTTDPQYHPYLELCTENQKMY